jgi:hypothetical protein
MNFGRRLVSDEVNPTVCRSPFNQKPRFANPATTYDNGKPSLLRTKQARQASEFLGAIDEQHYSYSNNT